MDNVNTINTLRTLSGILSLKLHQNETLKYFLLPKVQNTFQLCQIILKTNHVTSIKKWRSKISLASSRKRHWGWPLWFHWPPDIFSIPNHPFSDHHGKFPINKNYQNMRNSLSLFSYMLLWNTQMEADLVTTAWHWILTADIKVKGTLLIHSVALDYFHF